MRQYEKHSVVPRSVFNKHYFLLLSFHFCHKMYSFIFSSTQKRVDCSVAFYSIYLLWTPSLVVETTRWVYRNTNLPIRAFECTVWLREGWWPWTNEDIGVVRVWRSKASVRVGKRWLWEQHEQMWDAGKGHVWGRNWFSSRDGVEGSRGAQMGNAGLCWPKEALGCWAKPLGVNTVGDSQPLEGLEQSSKCCLV